MSSGNMQPDPDDTTKFSTHQKTSFQKIQIELGNSSIQVFMQRGFVKTVLNVYDSAEYTG